MINKIKKNIKYLSELYDYLKKYMSSFYDTKKEYMEIFLKEIYEPSWDNSCVINKIACEHFKWKSRYEEPCKECAKIWYNIYPHESKYYKSVNKKDYKKYKKLIKKYR